ncbi:helix-turn-helix transcriptional regulator [Halomonas halmophila]|uniref:HTH luxR-type domain-containing protein n=1 Tax=Halomonas halmophila TaxID=252 RepID=A0A4Y4EYS7_9GAMM|nr:response regulator transcription factor [Halomonas halmophila]GED23142.1 hypothetical protein HHA01_21190 [Halomonas halmophila]
MVQVFICPSGKEEVPRWREAFGDALTQDPDQALQEVASGDCVWVPSRLANWHQLVATLSQRGAIVCVLSLAPDAREALDALGAGARGYAHALSSPEVLRQMSLVTSHNGVWVYPELMAQFLSTTWQALGEPEPDESEVLQALTQRERAVALLVTRGRSNKEIAQELCIAERTVKAHLGAIYRKLGLRGRAQLLVKLSVPKAELHHSMN